MKLLLTICFVATATLFLASACNQNTTMNSDQDQSQYYPTPEEAAAKAKSDLVSILQEQTIKLNIEVAALKESAPGKMINHWMVDFNKLIETDTSANLSTLVSDSLSTIVPFMTGNRVIAIVELAHDQKGWRVAGLGNQEFMMDINAVVNASQSSAEYEIQVFEVPNIRAKFYQVRSAGGDVYYTDYKGSNINEAIKPASLVNTLKNDALIFQKNYGDSLKTRRLVD